MGAVGTREEFTPRINCNRLVPQTIDGEDCTADFNKIDQLSVPDE